MSQGKNKAQVLATCTSPSQTFTTAHIKMEGQDGETITDIQNYLETFNKEIQGGDQTGQATDGQHVGSAASPPEGTYFVDQSGQYYYQASGDQQQVMTVVSDPDGNGTGESISISIPGTIGDSSDGTQETTYVAMQPQDAHAVDSAMATLDDDAGGSDANGQVILNAGDAYQTVTIVPSDTNPGEVSYVLIVQQPDDKDDKDDQDLTVYDFDEGEEGMTMESGDEDDKSKIIKIMPKKSQTVTQAHMCNYCNYTSPKRYLLSRHMKSHSEERPHKCSVCERGFKTLASLQNHVNTHTGTKPHRCKFCDSAFTTSGELVRHVRYKHTHEKPHKCTECEYASVELSKLKRHMRCHTGERPYQCPHCTYASPDTFKLKRHLRIHTGERPYECDICHARFTQSNSLKAHKLIHTAGNKPVFQCELCPTTCGRKTDLRIHVQKLHTSDKPLKCKRCGKSFPDRYTYKVHNKTHEGEKCFKCDLCPYASISQRHLESHMLIHTDQKPFQCDQCDQSFRQKQLLKRHQNLYHNPNYVPPLPREKTHECPECGRAFRHKGNLIRHLAIHDPESSAQEKALALKLGRQKKIQIIDGQQVEVMPGEDDEDDDEDTDAEMMAVEGKDGQQYVVLEVIQLQDGDGLDQAVAVVAGDGSTHGSVEDAVAALHDDDDLRGEHYITPDARLADDDDVVHSIRAKRMTKKDAQAIRRKLETQKDMQNCFGFDDDEDDESHSMVDDDDDVAAKTAIQLLESINQ
ncbi:CCCTC-binding factor (CTCF) [Ladona fulva]|uniref:CCCTC-binding factor (CTCF) n=1 Tax=Ladona fulva TaxID=123851 RepID=A0A8K0K6I5_LADFU|nr:CCCTC-binding factor (CTCF) [Ladona fulva]KAG8228149.1 CCCTC-binding factor (CTCF) [Ladona fulva]KAG8228150.1 CCCTC-binding factor (CTCF) [Ladona fulva]